MDLPIRAYRHKLIRSGDVIEVYYYEHAIRVGHKRKRRRQKKFMPKVIEIKSEEEKDQAESD
jgi:ribosome-associated protein YbcJ (S4-like RNA binding protein)